MIKKILSILAIFVVMVALLGVMGAVAFRVFFPDEKLRQFVVNEGRWYLQREVSLKRLSLGLFSGLELEELAVSERPDLSAGTFLGAGRVCVKARLLPLLRHDVRFSEIRVENPKIRIARARDGSFNFEDLKTAFRQPGKTSVAGAAAPLPLLISDIQVTGGALEYSDALLHGFRVAVRDISFSARDLSAFKPFEARVSGVLAGKKAPIPFTARFLADVPHDRIEIKEAWVGAGKASLCISGALENVTGNGDMRLDLDMEGDPAVLDNFAALLPLRIDLTLFPLPRVHARISGTTGALSLRFR